MTAGGQAGCRQAGTERGEEDTAKQDEDDMQLTAFARVDGVAPGSPAADAVSSSSQRIHPLNLIIVMGQGLQREDLILAFGSLTFSGLSASVPVSAPSRLAPLATLASSHENVRNSLLRP